MTFNLCHCLLFLEKLCDAQLSDVFHEFSRASLNLARKWSRASSSGKSKTCKRTEDNAINDMSNRMEKVELDTHQSFSQIVQVLFR